MRKFFIIAVACLFCSCRTCKPVYTEDDLWSDAQLIAKQQQTITEQFGLIEQLGGELGELRQSVERAGEINTDLKTWARSHRELEGRIIDELYRLEELCRRACSGYEEAGYSPDGKLQGLAEGREESE